MAGKSNSTGKKKASRAAAHRSAANGTKAAAAHWVGQPIRRKEESRLVSGRGIFVDDERMPGMLHIRFVRSSYAHAKITRVDVSKAEVPRRCLYADRRGNQEASPAIHRDRTRRRAENCRLSNGGGQS